MMNQATEMAGPRLNLFIAADLQDHLMTACHDLDRLQVLLSGACDVLMDSFRGATEEISEHQRADLDGALAASLEPLQRKLCGAVTALQFQDMTSQLIQHTQRRLRSCADRMACEAFAGDDDGEDVFEPAPLGPNPVTQAEMDVGSVELF